MFGGELGQPVLVAELCQAGELHRLAGMAADEGGEAAQSRILRGLGQHIMEADVFRQPEPAGGPRRLHRRLGIAERRKIGGGRSEEHTSELQSLMRTSSAVLCLKKKKATHSTPHIHEIT